MANKFEMSTSLAKAVSRVMENEPKNWGGNEQLAMVRYLALECSKQARAEATEAEVDSGNGKKVMVKGLFLDGKLVHTIEVDWARFRDELTATNKLAEAANMKKALAEDYPQFRTQAAKKEEYA